MTMIRFASALLVVSCAFLASADGVRAQGFGVTAADALPSKGVRLDKQQVQRMRLGVVVTAPIACRGINATAPIPMDWPEQQTKVVAEDFSPSVKNVTYRTVGGTVKQMVMQMPYIPPGEECRAVITVEFTRYALLPPLDSTIFVMPNNDKLKPDIRSYLGPSPLIECNHVKIRNLAKELVGNPAGDKNKSKSTEAPPVEQKIAWARAEALYDWVRGHVEFREGQVKGAIAALKDGNGGTEDLTSLFIALCRASKIPARTVWVAGGSYPEFYLEDGDGKGYWFPCAMTGNREFGGISDFRPILEKGDNFQVPERKDRQRFIAEHLTGSGGAPQVQFLREMVAGG
jgi:hypothetical protein